MERLYTNSNARSDFIENAIVEAASSGGDVDIAVAFLTEADVVERLRLGSRRVRLVVRLGFPTSPRALSLLLKRRDVDIRFYSGDSFHPKLYLFRGKYALVGSANLTRSALTTNQEVVVVIGPEDPLFQDLGALFDDYWREGLVLNDDILATYEAVYRTFEQLQNQTAKLDEKLLDVIGHHAFPNISRGRTGRDVDDRYEWYRRTYQESVSAFRNVAAVYVRLDRRRATPEAIPLRLEIDSFLSYVRDQHAHHDLWEKTPVGWTPERERQVADLANLWFDAAYSHFEDTVVPVSWPLLSSVFGSEDSIRNADSNRIVDALMRLHSFGETSRYHFGGAPALRSDFLEKNDIGRIRDSLVYLLFGTGDVIDRMEALIWDENRKLAYFGQRSVQELVGWVNRDDLPVVNARTTKVLRFFGNEVQQL